jgi:predicted lipoprotein with Yx(FWY)xxD motif
VTLTSRTLTALALTGAVVLGSAAPAFAAVSYKNCTELHKSYPHGIGRSNATDHVANGGKPVTTWKKDTKGFNAAMAKNKGLDGDKDGVACEKK